MRILLADDQPAVRAALRLLLEQLFNMDLIDEVADTPNLLTQIIQLQPDLVLLDWELPGLFDHTLLQTLRSYVPHLKIIALSSRPEAQQKALAAGSDVFVSKGGPVERLMLAIDEMAPFANPHTH